MVRLHLKRGDQNLFLFDANLDTKIEQLIMDICSIYNGRLKVERICNEIEELADHGVALPPEFLGLNDEQIDELKLEDPWRDKCIPSGGFVFNKDKMGRRNGMQPNEHCQGVLRKTVAEAKEMITKKMVERDETITLKTIQAAINILKGATMIVYPMKLPPHDPIVMEFHNIEDLSETQASKEVIEPSRGQLWFAGRNMLPEKWLKDYIGNNDKTKVIIKLTKTGEGAPGREPAVNEEAKKMMMAESYRRQEVLKQLEQDNDDQYLNSPWADGSRLKRQMHGLENLKYRFGSNN